MGFFWSEGCGLETHVEKVFENMLEEDALGFLDTVGDRGSDQDEVRAGYIYNNVTSINEIERPGRGRWRVKRSLSPHSHI